MMTCTATQVDEVTGFVNIFVNKKGKYVQGITINEEGEVAFGEGEVESVYVNRHGYICIKPLFPKEEEE